MYITEKDITTTSNHLHDLIIKLDRRIKRRQARGLEVSNIDIEYLEHLKKAWSILQVTEWDEYY